MYNSSAGCSCRRPVKARRTSLSDRLFTMDVRDCETGGKGAHCLWTFPERNTFSASINAPATRSTWLVDKSAWFGSVSKREATDSAIGQPPGNPAPEPSALHRNGSETYRHRASASLGQRPHAL